MSMIRLVFMCISLMSWGVMGKTDQDKSEPIHIFGENGIEIDRERQEIRAFKNAYVKRGTSTVFGDVIYGYYKQDSKGKLSLSKVDALGNVKITMPDKVLRAREGTYDVQKDMIFFQGDVRVTEKNNHLKGDYATMDRKTGQTLVLNHNPLKAKAGFNAQTQSQVRVLLGGKRSAE
ncbi:MAG: LptA/OstA family protein [Alphaproteobacteria bacterium]